MIFQPLSEGEKQVLETTRHLALRLMQADSAFTVSDLQRAYDDVVENHPDHPKFQIALGIAFGEIIVREENYEWVRVIDEYGEETALSPKDVNVACFPISMIQKRLTSRARVTILDLVAETINTVEKMRESGNYEKH